MAWRAERISTGVGVVAGLLAGQVVWVLNRPLPSLEGLDASGIEGPHSGWPLRIAVLGDSTCTGPGLKAPEEIWVRQMARRLAPRWRVHVQSFARGGAKASDVVRHQLHSAVASAPDVAVVSVGGNDALRAVPARLFRRHLTEIVTRLKPVAPIILASGVGDMGAIPRLPRPLADLARLRGVQFNRIHTAIGRRYGVLVADQWSWAAREFRTRPELFAADQFHASAAGHAVWASVALETLAPHLERFAPSTG